LKVKIWFFQGGNLVTSLIDVGRFPLWAPTPTFHFKAKLFNASSSESLDQTKRRVYIEQSEMEGGSGTL